MAHDTKPRLRLRLQQSYPHHRARLSLFGADRDARQLPATVTGLGPDDGYDWLQRIGRTRAPRRWTAHGTATL